MLERVELFSRTVGQTSDIVEKEMYAFSDRDDTVVALRPEGTASVVRAYIEAGLPRSMPIARLFYVGPMFRRERPQKGRFRQFTQIGAELLGREDPEADAETLSLVADICSAAGAANARIDVNSLGDSACRPAYREALSAFGRARQSELCEECRTRLERNPLRLLDCKNQGCREALADAPTMLEHLCSACQRHHQRVLDLVALAGVELTTNPRMVRGLDYYCRTAFEVVGFGLGAQDAIGGGGRYDGLVAALGGPDVAGIGFAFGLERLDMASGGREANPPAPEFCILPIGEAAAGPAATLARTLRAARHVVDLGHSGRKLKNQLARAEKAGARYAIILGDAELAAGRATVRDMLERTERTGCFAIGASARDIIASVEGAANGEA